MKYDCLIASGCSHTFGSGYKDVDAHRTKHSQNAWPHVLGEVLGIEEVYNVAKSGGGNDYITRSLVKEIEKHPGEKILVGMMLTGLARFEIVVGPGLDLKHNVSNEWYNIGPWNQEFTWIENYFEYAHSDFCDMYRTLHNLHYLQLYFADKDIDYFIMYSDKQNMIDLSLTTNDDDLNRFKSAINWDNFFYPNDDGYLNWCYKRGYKSMTDHFLEDACRDFVEQELAPWVKEKFIT